MVVRECVCGGGGGGGGTHETAMSAKVKVS